jgi:hypothetical protein
MVVLADELMAKRIDIAVKIDAEVVRLGKIVAAYKDISLAEYFSENLMPLVLRDLELEQAKLTEKMDSEKPKPGKKK